MKLSHTAVPAIALLLANILEFSAVRAETSEENYRLYCVQCHGSEGNGQGINETAGGLSVSPRDHTSAEEMSKLSDDEIRLAVAEGGDVVQKSGLMPAWGSTLTAKEIDELVFYLRTLCACVGRK
ncbi:MAG: c-type cytochrome [Kiloniellales bacterium]